MNRAGVHGKQGIDDARSRALSILNALDLGGRTLDSLLEEMDFKASLDPRDRAFLNTLVYGVLRWRGRLDEGIRRFSNIRLKKIDPKVLNILRIGLFQILYLDRVPVSAAVNTSVEMTKSIAAPWVVKFVNAVMRKMAEKPSRTQEPPAAKPGATSLATELSFPEWLVTRWVKRFGEAETRALCEALNSIPPTTVRTNTLKWSREELKGELAGDVSELWCTPYSAEGISFTGARQPIGRMSAFLAGGFQVQDEGAQLTAHLLSPLPGETILDACAGLGGKTGHLAQLMNNQGRIIAMDVNGDKLHRLELEMQRLGITIVRTVQADLAGVPTFTSPALFDRILLDAPCSGLGVIRRNPDTKWYFSEKELARCGQRQREFLGHLASKVKPGGLLMYVVCSTEPEENESVVEGFLSDHSDFKTEPYPCGPEMNAAFFTSGGFFRTLPHRDQMDGFFGARFRRTV
ncbi:MAG: 16S rRNA (cytosine(967)-C(5))-methyltransferase RsmB [Pseudomonadota bacterium]